MLPMVALFRSQRHKCKDLRDVLAFLQINIDFYYPHEMSFTVFRITSRRKATQYNLFPMRAHSNSYINSGAIKLLYSQSIDFFSWCCHQRVVNIQGSG